MGIVRIVVIAILPYNEKSDKWLKGGKRLQEIREIEGDIEKNAYLPLLLLADEEEKMIEKYLYQGRLYALFIPEKIGVIVVTQEEERVFEIKNLGILPEYQGKGYGKTLIQHIEGSYQSLGDTLLVGTGDSPLTVPFYIKCGFTYSHRIKNFFTDHYEKPIIEAGKRLIDMVYYKKDLRK